MEGRDAPPKADHPFPGEVRFDNWKSNARHVTKWAAWTLAIIVPWFCITGYLYRNETHLFGIKYSFTAEEARQKRAILFEAAKLRRMGTPIDVNAHSVNIEKLGNQDPDLGLTRVVPADGSNVRARIGS